MTKKKYELIEDEKSLKIWCDLIESEGIVAIDCETDSLNAVDAEIVGFSMSVENSKACYIPLKHKSEKNNQIQVQTFINLVGSRYEYIIISVSKLISL